MIIVDHHEIIVDHHEIIVESVKYQLNFIKAFHQVS
jgi:hypothetical protein